jgi:hypothetical protein
MVVLSKVKAPIVSSTFQLESVIVAAVVFTRAKADVSKFKPPAAFFGETFPSLKNKTPAGLPMIGQTSGRFKEQKLQTN